MSLRRERRDEMLRVDHAGEYGAVAIYRGQLAVFERQHGKERIVGQLKQMRDEEQDHLDAFDRMLAAGHVRPTAFSPLWNAAVGFALGVGTALLGEEGGACGRGSNSRQPAWKAGALPTELLPHNFTNKLCNIVYISFCEVQIYSICLF